MDPGEPSAIVLELRDGGDEQVAHVRGSEAYDAVQPFPVRLVPAELLD